MADHVTLFRMKAQAGKRQAVIDQFAKWEREHKAAAKGFQRSVLVTSNDNPDELMAADPEWFNGTLAREVVG